MSTRGPKGGPLPIGETPLRNSAGGASGAGSGGNDAVIRGELVEKEGKGPTLVAVRRLRWGTAILAERPILLVEADPYCYLKAGDADPRLAELAEAMGDPMRLATYVAFKQLHERKQKELLSFWREGIEENDPVAKAIFEANRGGADAFIKDRPEFSKLVYWNHFVLVASIFGRFGIVNPDGTRAVYAFCSHVKHSCSPNAAWFTNRTGFPKGKKTLHVISLEGIPRGAEISVNQVDESILVLPKAKRCERMFRGAVGISCDCRRCLGASEKDDEKIRQVFSRLQMLLDEKPPTHDSTRDAQQCLKDLDKLLPFSMQMKAKAKVLLASAFGELSARCAWEGENKGANIIHWTGMDPESQEQRLKDTKKLYETAAKDFEYLLGQDALGIIQRMEAGYGPVHDQHKMLAKYTKEREVEEPAIANGTDVPPEYRQEPFRNPYAPEGLPPGWDELFKGKQPS